MRALARLRSLVLERRLLIWIVVAVVIIAALAGAFRLFTLERYFVYFPSREVTADPSAYGMAFEDVTISASDGTSIHGWFIPGRTDVTMLWFHGNAGNIANRLDNLRKLHDAVGANVFIIDYRGYGRSDGSPSENGTYLDAAAALDYLVSRPDVRPDRIVYFGRSLGAAVAVELAMHRAPYGLALETPFPSIRSMAREAYPFLPLGPLLTMRYDTTSKLGRVTSPVLVMHGDSDTIVPIALGRRVFEAANEPKEFYVIPGAGHNDTYVAGGQEYFARLRAWLDKIPG